MISFAHLYIRVLRDLGLVIWIKSIIIMANEKRFSAWPRSSERNIVNQMREGCCFLFFQPWKRTRFALALYLMLLLFFVVECTFVLWIYPVTWLVNTWKTKNSRLHWHFSWISFKDQHTTKQEHSHFCHFHYNFFSRCLSRSLSFCVAWSLDVGANFWS